MKQTILYTIFSLTVLSHSCGQTQKSKHPDNSKIKEYRNNIYRFSVDIPGNWKLYGQIINDTVNRKAIADWGAPICF